MHDQPGHHDVEVVCWEFQRFGCADVELAVAGARLVAGIPDHRRRWIDADDSSLGADSKGEQPCKIARAAADIQHPLASLHASDGDQCPKVVRRRPKKKTLAKVS